jgi:transcriptional regulator with XRE-family HTH domain
VPESKFAQAEELFRATLRNLRQEQGLTQAQLAERLGLPQSYVSKYETGERRLDFVETIFICEALEIPVKDFIDAFLQKLDKRSRRNRR